MGTSASLTCPLGRACGKASDDISLPNPGWY